jgi:hypothetical protein
MAILGEADGLMRRQAWPLVASLAAHVALALFWLNASHKLRTPDQEPRRLTVLLLPKAAPVKPPAPAPRRPDRPAERQRNTAARPTEPVVAKPLPASATPPAGSTAREPVALTAAPSAAAILESARHDAGRIDRELRGKKADVLGNIDTPLRRMAQAMAGAYNDNSLKEDSFTSPDGVVTYRRRMGNKTVCRKTGSVGPPAPWRSESAIMAGAGRQSTLGVGGMAGDYLCPDSDRDWKKQ